MTAQQFRAEKAANNEAATQMRRESERVAILSIQRASAEEFFLKTQAYMKAAKAAAEFGK